MTNPQKTTLIVFSCLFVLGGLVFATWKFIKLINIPVETSQGVVMRTHVNYSISNSHKTMEFIFIAPGWFETANKDLVGKEICDFISGSDWGTMGVTPKNANDIHFQVQSATEKPFDYACKLSN